MEKTKGKKVIPASTVVKALIRGHVSYGIILGFLVCTAAFFLKYIVDRFFHSNSSALTLSSSIILGIIIYYVVHLICKLSTLDLFRKCKTNSSNTETISEKMNLFFIVCVILSVVASITILYLTLSSNYISLKIAEIEYGKVFSKNFTSILSNEMLADYNLAKTRTIITSITVEISLVVSLLSLISYQPKMISEFNDKKK